MLLLLVLGLAGCVVGQTVVNIDVTANTTGAGSTSGGSTSSATVHTYPPSTTQQPTGAPSGGNATNNNTNTTTGGSTTSSANTTSSATTAPAGNATTAPAGNATTAPAGSGNNVTSNGTNTSNNATNVTCADQTSLQRCTAFGRGAGGESTDYRACVWCGVSATDGLCREPVWSGNYSCPLETGSFFNYECLPGDSVAACGSHCINSCETVCRDYRAPVYTITMFNDSSCTNLLTGPTNLTRSCLPLANGGSIGLISFSNNSYSELNYMCANCRPCEPTCTNNHTYCECTKVAGLSNLYMVISPKSNNCSLNGTQSAGGANNTNTTNGTNTTNTTTTVTNTTATASPNATNTTGSGNTSNAGTTNNVASTTAGQTAAPSQRAAAGVLTTSAAAIVAVLLLVVSTV